MAEIKRPVCKDEKFVLFLDELENQKVVCLTHIWDSLCFNPLGEAAQCDVCRGATGSLASGSSCLW